MKKAFSLAYVRDVASERQRRSVTGEISANQYCSSCPGAKSSAVMWDTVRTRWFHRGMHRSLIRLDVPE